MEETGVGCTTRSAAGSLLTGAKSLPQCLQTLASSCTISAQYGHFLMGCFFRCSFARDVRTAAVRNAKRKKATTSPTANTVSPIFEMMSSIAMWCECGLTKKAEPPPIHDVNRDSGTDSANGGWLRRLVRHQRHKNHNKIRQIKTLANLQAPHLLTA
jgi:hypothetical protein